MRTFAGSRLILGPLENWAIRASRWKLIEVHRWEPRVEFCCCDVFLVSIREKSLFRSSSASAWQLIDGRRSAGRFPRRCNYFLYLRFGHRFSGGGSTKLATNCGFVVSSQYRSHQGSNRFLWFFSFIRTLLDNALAALAVIGCPKWVRVSHRAGRQLFLLCPFWLRLKLGPQIPCCVLAVKV